MFVICGVRNLHVLGVPTVPVAGLVAADEQDCALTGIECVEEAQVTPNRAQLLHVVMTRRLDELRASGPQGRPLETELLDRPLDSKTIFLGQPPEPTVDFWRVDDDPRAVTLVP